MTRQLMKTFNGYAVTYHSTYKGNRFVVTYHGKVEGRYADYYSCVYHIMKYSKNFEEIKVK